MRQVLSFVAVGSLYIASLAAVGCAPMSVGAPMVTDVPKGHEERVSANGQFDDEVRHEGSRVALRVTDLCDVQRIERIERTTVREHHNDAPGNDWLAGIGGAVLAGTGVVSVASPETLRRGDVELSKNEVRGTGYALIGVGALLLTIPVIDAIRVHRVAERHVEQVEAPGPFLKHGIPCTTPRRERDVFALFPNGRELFVGSLSSQGRLNLSLAESTPHDWSFAREDAVSFRVGNREIGKATLAALYDERDAIAWQLTESSDCESSLADDACSPQEAYLSRYPRGNHAATATQLITAAANRRHTAREEAAWKQLDLQACAKPPKRNLLAIEAACEPLTKYLGEFPAGERASTVRDALHDGRAVYAALQEAAERRASARVAPVSTGNFIPYAGNGRGPTLCADGSWSHSSGRGTCSHHGGIAR